MDDLIGPDPCEGCKLPCPGSHYLTCIPRQRRDARRDLIGVLKATGAERDTGSCGLCGGPMSRNPHPDAGKPDQLLQVGAMYDCIPCSQKALHHAVLERDTLRTEVSALQSELSSLSLEAKSLRHVAHEAILQIEYLQEKFGETGTGNAVLARLRAASGEKSG